VGDQLDLAKIDIFNIFGMLIDLFEKYVKSGLEKFDFEGAIVITAKVDFVKDERCHSLS
jgi:hypothetical protein